MIGERIRLAREACLLTQSDLAEVANVSQGTLSDIEAGAVVSPSKIVVERIAAATLYPVSFFYAGALPDLPEGHYRKRKKGTVKATKQIRAQARQVLEIVQRSEDALHLPPVRLEPVASMSGGLEAVEAVAAAVRASLGVGARDPIPNLIRAAERAGVVVARLPTEMTDHDGFSAWPDYGLGGRPLLAISAGHPGDRDRFTVAHELGHLILHTLRGTTIEPGPAEQEANRFAGALLIPRDAARDAMHPPVTLRVLMGVKATFGTSIAMSAQRALDLRLITRDHFVSLRKQLSARGWTHDEPVEVPQERPILIANILDYMAGSGGSTAERATRVAMPMFTFRALAG